MYCAQQLFYSCMNVTHRTAVTNRQLEKKYKVWQFILYLYAEHMSTYLHTCAFCHIYDANCASELSPSTTDRKVRNATCQTDVTEKNRYQGKKGKPLLLR